MPDLERIVRRQRVIAGFGDLVLRSDDLDEVLAEACRLVSEALGTGRAKVIEIEHQTRMLLVRAGVGWKPGIVGVLRMPMEEDTSETFSIAAGLPVVSRDTRDEGRFRIAPFLLEAGVVSLVNVPIFLPGGQPYGLLEVDDTVPRDFGEEDTAFLRTYASLLGPVIDRLHKVRRLSATEERLRRVVETEAVGVVFFDHGGFVVDANGAFLGMTGYTRDDIASGTLTWRRMTPPERLAERDAQMATLSRTGRIGPSEVEYLLANGSCRWMLFAGRDLGDGAFAAHCIDVTDRRREEAALRDSEARYRTLFEAIDEGFCIVDVLFDADGRAKDYRFREVNPAFQRQTGLRDAVGRTIRELAPAHEAHWFETYGRVALTGEPVRFENEAEALGGRRFDVFAFRIGGPEQRRVAILFTDVTARRRAETSLRESEARLRALVTATSYVAYSMSPDWTELRQLDGAGFLADRAEPSSAWLDKYIHPDDQSRVMAAIQHAIRTRGVFDLEHRVRRADGTLGWTHSRAVPLLDADGAIREWFGAASDVTGRKRTEAALRESEESFRQFGGASPDVLWIRDAETLRWEYLTPAFEQTYGMEVDRALRGDTLANWLDLVVPEDRECALASIMRVCAGERVAFEYRIRRPSDGDVRWLRDTDFPLADEHGRVRRIGGIVQDVTEIRQAEERLRESEARLRAMVDAVPQIAWTADSTGHHGYYNRRWYDYTGLSPADTAAEGWATVVHPDDLATTRARWTHSVRSGDDYEIEYRFRGVDGTYRWFIGRGVAVRAAADDQHPDGRVDRWFGTCTDIEDMVRARDVLARSRAELEALVAARTEELTVAAESLRQAQKMEAVGQLTGGIAHDFNNMLQGVSGALDMMRRRIAQGRGEETGRYLDAALESVARAAGLTQRLLAFARRQRLDPQAVDADRLVAGLADLIRRTTGPAVEVRLRLRDSAGSVLCDPNELESALLNLCINARDAMPDGGRLEIATEEADLAPADIPGGEAMPGSYVAISVTDTGTGMPPEVLGHVFEPFFTTKPQGQGTGLGLSQVWGFARQSGGLVRIASTPGRGTSVRLLLPLNRSLQAAPKPAPAPAPEGDGTLRTVLLVDDEDAVRGPAAERLRELGHAVLEARDGPEALRVLASTRPNLLVTDVGLPHGMNGRQLAEAARERLPGLPVLFITGYAGTSLPQGVEVIGKPFDLDTLAARVQAVLGAGQGGSAKGLDT